MYQSILVPLDGSKRAERILSHAEELARQCKASIILLRVVEPDPEGLGTYSGSVSLYRESFKRWEEEAKAYLTGIKGELSAKGLDVRRALESGPVVKKIIEVADSEDVDLIAMASHGRTGLSSAFYGSVAAGVLHQVDRPLLLIRADED
ncbi:MAG: universal stress protein [Anaerolineales bacterium]|jgi:nucleotide-binding universal stress UspA family protein